MKDNSITDTLLILKDMYYFIKYYVFPLDIMSADHCTDGPKFNCNLTPFNPNQMHNMTGKNFAFLLNEAKCILNENICELQKIYRERYKQLEYLYKLEEFYKFTNVAKTDPERLNKLKEAEALLHDQWVSEVKNQVHSMYLCFKRFATLIQYDTFFWDNVHKCPELKEFAFWFSKKNTLVHQLIYIQLNDLLNLIKYLDQNFKTDSSVSNDICIEINPLFRSHLQIIAAMAYSAAHFLSPETLEVTQMPLSTTPLIPKIPYEYLLGKGHAFITPSQLDTCLSHPSKFISNLILENAPNELSNQTKLWIYNQQKDHLDKMYSLLLSQIYSEGLIKHLSVFEYAQNLFFNWNSKEFIETLRTMVIRGKSALLSHQKEIFFFDLETFPDLKEQQNMYNKLYLEFMRLEEVLAKLDHARYRRPHFTMEEWQIYEQFTRPRLWAEYKSIINNLNTLLQNHK